MGRDLREESHADWERTYWDVNVGLYKARQNLFQIPTEYWYFTENDGAEKARNSAPTSHPTTTTSGCAAAFRNLAQTGLND
jgi:hypothetical protein